MKTYGSLIIDFSDGTREQYKNYGDPAKADVLLSVHQDSWKGKQVVKIRYVMTDYELTNNLQP